MSDLDGALSFYREVLGLVPHPPETADGAEIVSLSFGESQVELLTPTDPASPIAKFLATRGPAAGWPPSRRSARDPALCGPRRSSPYAPSRAAR